MRLEKQVDNIKKSDEGKSRNQEFPEWIGEFPDDPAKVETKAGRVAVDSANVQDAPRKGGLAIHGRFCLG